MRNLTFIAVCAAAAIIAGCAAAPPSQFYTLCPSASPTAPALSCIVAVGPVSIPALVDRPQMVLRRSPNQVGIDEFNRWAAPLQGDIARVVADNLGTILGSPNVTVFPHSASSEAAYRVVIDVLRFDSAPGTRAEVDALWTVRATKGGRLRSGRASIIETIQGGAGDCRSLVAAHSAALGRLSIQIAADIRELERQEK